MLASEERSSDTCGSCKKLLWEEPWAIIGNDAKQALICMQIQMWCCQMQTTRESKVVHRITPVARGQVDHGALGQVGPDVQAPLLQRQLRGAQHAEEQRHRVHVGDGLPRHARVVRFLCVRDLRVQNACRTHCMNGHRNSALIDGRGVT